MCDKRHLASNEQCHSAAVELALALLHVHRTRQVWIHGQALVAVDFLSLVISSPNPLEVSMAVSTYDILPALLQRRRISMQTAVLLFMQST